MNLGIRDFKAKSGGDSGLKVSLEVHASNVANDEKISLCDFAGRFLSGFEVIAGRRRGDLGTQPSRSP